MNSPHPALRRAWLQTGGMPVDPIHADLRAAFDQVHDVEWLAGGCFRLRNAAGRQVGLIQFQGPDQAAVDAAVMRTTERLAAGEEKPVDIIAGDTVIRSLDMSDPVDRELAGQAITGADPAIVVPDLERPDLPPVDLPDRAPDLGPIAADQGDLEPADVERSPWMALAAVFLALALVAAIVAAYLVLAR